MEEDKLNELKRKINGLSKEEKKERNIYLQELASGKVLGPQTGYASIDRPWVKYFDEDLLNLELNDISMYDYMYMKAFKFKNKTAIEYYGRKISFKNVLDKIDDVAKSLKAQGINKGDKVVLLLPSDPEAVYTVYALNKIGAVSCPIDPRTTVEILHKTLEELKPKMIIGLDMCNKLIEKSLKDIDVKKVVLVSAMESLPLPLKEFMKVSETFKNIGKEKEKNPFLSWKEFLESGNHYDKIVNSVGNKNDLAAIIYTGGTTGTKKGVELSNANINAMVEQHLKSGISFSEGQKFLDFLPPFIVYGLVMAIHMPLSLGFDTTMVPVFEAKDFPKLIFKTKTEYVFASPVHYEALMNYDGKKDYSFLKVPVSGGDSMTKEFEEKVNKDLKEHNCPTILGQGLGMSEAGGTISVPFTGHIKTGSVGLPFGNTNIGIFEVNSDRELNYNQKGEICFQGPSLMMKYYNNEEETQNVLRKHNDETTWLHTGDIGYIDEDGYLYHTDRIKRIINRGGLKVFPKEVENVILQNTNVTSCSVVSMDNPLERHVPIAHIVLKENTDIESTLKDILDLCKSKLYPESIPFGFKIHLELPYTLNGKVDYKKLELDTNDIIYSDSLNDEIKLIRKK